MNHVINKHNAEKYIWGNNCSSWVLNDDTQLSIKQELMPPGTKEQLHFHERATQFFYVLKGKATFFCEDKTFDVDANEGLSVQVNQKHFIANEGNETLEFLVISQPTTTNDRINL